MRGFMSNRRYSWALLSLAVCPGTAGAQEDGTAQALERLGAIVQRNGTKPAKPVVAVIFGVRPPLPNTASETLHTGFG
jgi:hypothetical protein